MNQNNGDKIIISIKGNMRRSRDCAKPFLIYVNKDVLNDINVHCKGPRQSVINELIRVGLDKLKKESEND